MVGAFITASSPRLPTWLAERASWLFSPIKAGRSTMLAVTELVGVGIAAASHFATTFKSCSRVNGFEM
jgi:hypothetical protein